MRILDRPLSLAACALLCCSLLRVSAADPSPQTLSANELASRLSTLQQDGSSYIRLRLEVKPPAGREKTAIQVQIMQRRTKASTDVIYQVLWPKERKGEAVLLKKPENGPATGTYFVPPATMRPLGSANMRDPLFESDLSYADLIENFFSWETQRIIGEEMVGPVRCQILESLPGKGQRSAYTSVRTWVDTERLVPLRVEKFLAPGKPPRRIETSRVSKESDGRHIPASLEVRGPGSDSVTSLEGSRINTSVTYEQRDFDPDALKEMRKPPAASE